MMLKKLLFFFGMVVAVAQPSTLVFEVASVKPDRAGTNESSISRDGGRIAMDNVSLRECIMFAYGIPTGREYELTGPAWMDTEKFEIDATFPEETSGQLLREMTQSLLAERFSLKAHRANRRVKAYELVTVKGGPRLTPTLSGDDGAFTYREGRVIVRAFSMPAFAARLSGPMFKLDRPVLDKTRLQGSFDFTLEWAPDGRAEPGASLFTALQEQLGLKLEARQAEVRILVVVRVDRTPSGN
jgi:uncharacterized protein (TIGR03435 family)